MNKLEGYHTVAEAVRIEQDTKDDTIFLVFKIVDEGFKRRIKNNWMNDVPLKLIGKTLVEGEE